MTRPFLALFLQMCTPLPSEPPLNVYLLAGQSNMNGRADVAGLPKDLQADQPDVRFYWSEDPEWTALHPASSLGEDYFGPEVTFGSTAGAVAIIKHAVPGTDLAEDWDPETGPEYAALYDTTTAALDVLDAEGTDYQVAGFAWMQGEADATDPDEAAAYEDNLTAFVSAVREDYDTTRVVIGKINVPDYPYRDDVRAAQEAVAAADDEVVLVDTDGLSMLDDDIHYDSDGQQELGQLFAEAM